MNTDSDPVLDEEYEARLLACEEALATGAPASIAEDTSPEMRTRLMRGLACVKRLQQLRPRNQPTLHGDTELPVAVNADTECPAQIGRFEVRCLLGRGGFGMVYRAYDPMLCREVALKIPRAEALADADCLARFQREARAAAGLDHPNLVPVHEAGRLGPICYIAYAYCPGSDLAAWLKQRTGPVRSVDAARLVRTLARAVHYAHGRGTLHRDLKPSNILLSPVDVSAAAPAEDIWQPETDTAYVPRVTDFGLAKLAVGDQAQTQTGCLLGTPGYMAPEQMEVRLGTVGPATDVYALGVILYEVLTGRPPFWAETPVATLLQVKTIEPVMPTRLRPELPRDLETICLKCLHKEPRKRYASAEALAEDLDRFLAGKSIHARPSSRAELALKWFRRHPSLAASLCALLFVTLLGTGGIFWEWQQVQGALAEAKLQEKQAKLAEKAETRARQKSDVALYHHQVMLAHDEWLAGNVGRTSQLLAECRGDLRNWEWRYVRQLCNSAVFTCADHSAHVSSVAYSPDGRYFASASGLWSSSEPGEVKLWDAATGELLWTGEGNSGPVMSVAFSPDGQKLATVTTNFRDKNNELLKNNEIRLWETATGKPLKTLSNLPRGNFSVAFSPDGKRLATGGADAKVRLWDADLGQELFVLEGHRANVFSVAFSPDGQQLASGGWDGSAIIWDLANQRRVQTLHGPNDIRSVAYSPDGQYLVTASFGHHVKIWDIASGHLVRTYWGHGVPVLCAAFAPDGRRIASTDTAGKVHVWDVDTGRLYHTVLGHTGAVAWAAYSPDGSRLATAGRDRTVRIWDLTRKQDSHSLPQAAGALNVVFSRSGRLLAAAGYSHSGGKMEKRVRVWVMPSSSEEDLADPRCWEGHNRWLRCVAFSPDEKLLASGSADRTVRLWDVATEQTVSILEHHTSTVMSVAFNFDGTCLATAGEDRTVQLWDVSTPAKIKSPRATVTMTHPNPVRDVAFSPDGRRLVAVGEDGMVLVWETATGKKLFALPGHVDVVERGVFSPDGQRLATAGWDKKIRIWDMSADPRDGEPAVPLHVLEGHTDHVVGLCFTPDGSRLASTGGDQTIRIWDVASGSDSLTLRGHPDTICGVAFSPDGRLLVSASTRDIKVWDAGGAAKSGPAQSRRDAQSWHRQESLSCRTANPPHWHGVLFHTNRLLEAQPNDWRLWECRAQAKAELGQWRQAKDDAAHSIALGAEDPCSWYVQAVACVHLADPGAYSRCCTEMLDRFGPDQMGAPADFERKHARADQANNTAWVCVLGPAAAANPDQAVRLARIAVAAEPDNECYRNTLGAALYRANRCEEACVCLHETVRQQKDGPDDWLFLAMVHHGLGKADAQGWLDKATQWRDAARRDRRAAGTSGIISSSQLAQIEVLHREAAKKLEAAPE